MCPKTGTGNVPYLEKQTGMNMIELTLYHLANLPLPPQKSSTKNNKANIIIGVCECC